MSKGVNRVILIGNLGADPEVRYTAGGDAVTNIRLATTDSWRDRQTGEQQEKTEWHRVALFKKLGEIAGEYLKKGSKAYIEGRLQTKKWTGQDGVDRYTTEIIATDMQMLDSRGDQGGQQPAQSGGPGPEAGDGDDFGDGSDIPFVTSARVW